MEHFFFVRHGQTDANLQGLMCGGRWDISLNETGIAQAFIAAQKLDQAGAKIGGLGVSPLLRARKTAEIIAAQLGQPTLTVIAELAEWDIGHWDRVPFESVKDDFLGSGEPRGGESRAVFKARVARAFDRCTQLDLPPLIVSHGAVWLALQELLNIPPVKVENGIPYRVTRESGGKWQLLNV